MTGMWIECFCSAVEMQSFTAAAQKICISQPAFSRNIAMMEEEMGLQLFYRNKQNGVRLTPAGLVVYNGLVKMRELYGKTLNDARQIDRGEAGKLVVGFLHSARLRKETKDYIDRFCQAYPKVQVELRAFPLAKMEESLLNGTCDVCFMMANTVRDRENILFEKLDSMERYLLVPKSLHVDPAKRYSMRDFADQTFIMTENFPQMQESFIQRCRNSGFEPKIRMAPDFETALLLASMGEGVTGCLRNDYVNGMELVDIIQLEETDAMDYVIAWKRENYNPIIALFYAELQERPDET